MNLEELAAVARPAPARPGVPRTMLGCFRRRSITFFDGATDTRTEVYWLQSRGLSADLRVYARRPALGHCPGLAAASTEELLALVAAVEGGLAPTEVEGEVMRWGPWTGFQTHARWPEPGRLQRVGDCLIELAPSGAYVEDWRFQPSPPGPLVGLLLLEERRGAEVRHRGGGLLVCGRHAALVRGRPTPLPEGKRLDELLRHALAEGAAAATHLLGAIFACEISYATLEAPPSPTSAPARFQVRRSTHPWREGRDLLSLEGFDYDRDTDRVRQRTTEDGVAVERLFAVETLEAKCPFEAATPASAQAAAWLASEGDVLLPDARPLEPRA